jgi:RNA polymerase sigma-70 factor (ECF subfamily)
VHEAFGVNVPRLGSGRHAAPVVSQVYTELAPAVLGFFRSHRMRDAEDLTGDVFVRVTKSLPDFKGDEAALRRWVFTIAHHRLVDEYRRSGRSRELSMSETPETIALDPTGGDPALTAALATLTPEQREVLVLRFVADLPLHDVAKIVGKRLGAVKMLQMRGLAELRQTLGEAAP